MTPKYAAGGRSAGLAAAELAFIVALAVADFYGKVPLSRTPFLLLLGWVSLRLRGLRWRDVGFRRPPHWPRALASGAVAGIALELFSTFVSVPFWSQLTGRPPDLADFRPMVGNLRLVLAFLLPMWLLAAFGEELAFRGYLMSRVAGFLRDTRSAWPSSLLLASVYFGWGHDMQGVTGVLQEAFAGLLLGLLYLGCGRNLTVPIVAHGVSNTLAFLLIYLDRYPGV
jgi:membrane protease YdiL (CAAX protease family)